MPSAASKITDITPQNLENVIKAVNAQHYNLLELESVVRRLENRIDNFSPTTMHMTVLPTSKLVLGVTLVAAAVGGYIAYTEVRRSNKQD